jgi:hypothetical protein
MTIIELQTAFQQKTTIQKDELLAKLIGEEINIQGSISDIGPDEIKLHTIYYEFYHDSKDFNYLQYIKLKYDKEKFARTLLTYQNGEDVKIVAILLGKENGQSSMDTFVLELYSIIKTGSTSKSRHDAHMKNKESSCFIATACYGDYDAPEVFVLRKFRDEKLLKTYLGKVFVKLYYTFSPFFASLISKSESLKKVVRNYFLEPIVSKLQKHTMKNNQHDKMLK